MPADPAATDRTRHVLDVVAAATAAGNHLRADRERRGATTGHAAPEPPALTNPPVIQFGPSPRSLREAAARDTVPCPHCHAQPGEFCRDRSGAGTRVHWERTHDYRAALPASA